MKKRRKHAIIFQEVYGVKNKRGIFWILGTIGICALFLVALFFLGKNQNKEEKQKEKNIENKKAIKEDSDLVKTKFDIGSEITYQDGYFFVQSPDRQFLYTEKGQKIEETDGTIEFLYDQYYILKKEDISILKRNGKEIAALSNSFGLYKDEDAPYVMASSSRLDDHLAVYNNENTCKTCFSTIYDYKTGESKKEFQGELLKIELPSKKEIYYAVRDKGITLLKNNLDEIGSYTNIKLKQENSIYQNPSNEYFIVSKNNRWGIIDIEGKEQIPISYEDIEYKINEKNWFVAKKNGKYGVISIDNEVILPFSYTKIEQFTNYLLLQNGKKIQIIDGEKNTIYEKDSEESLLAIESNGNLILQWNKEKESLDEKRLTFIYSNKEVKEMEGVSIHYDEDTLNHFVLPKIVSSVITGFQIYNSDLEYIGLYSDSLTKKDYYEITFLQNLMLLKLKNAEEEETYKVISLNKEAKELYKTNTPIYKIGNYFVLYNKQIELYSATFELEKKIVGNSIKQIKEKCYQITDDEKVYLYQD